jgi:chromosome segregation ATPase
MSTEIDFVIQRLESDLKKRGIKNEKQINNYIKEKKENNQLINGGDPINYDKIASTNTINQLENNFYQNILQFKSEVKNYIDNINTKIFNIEKNLLKINLINDNYRDSNSRLAKVENDYKLFYNEFAKTNSICIENKKNVEYIKEVITEQSKENNILTKELKINMKNILNRQTFLDAKINENNNNNINFEKKIIDKINNLYKEKEDILNIQSKNLISKIIENSNQYESKFQLINNSISEIKSRIDNADNNINILNDIPNFKSLTNNINNQVLEINTKIEEISKFQKDIDENKNKINNLKNEIQEINSNIENIHKFNNFI